MSYAREGWTGNYWKSDAIDHLEQITTTIPPPFATGHFLFSVCGVYGIHITRSTRAVAKFKCPQAKFWQSSMMPHMVMRVDMADDRVNVLA